MQEFLEKCSESLQEIINYHMVSQPPTHPINLLVFKEALEGSVFHTTLSFVHFGILF